MMNDCNEIRKQLSDYVDGVLQDDAAWRVRMHLSTCSDCTRITHEIASIVHLLQSARPVALSSTFDSTLAAKVAAAQRPPHRRTGLLLRIRSGFGAPPRTAGAHGRWSLVLSACLLIAIALTIGPAALRWDRHHSAGGAITGSPMIRATADTLGAGDLAFVAVCSSQHARYASAQPLADPSAETLASQIDETGGTGGTATPAATDNAASRNRADDLSETD